MSGFFAAQYKKLLSDLLSHEAVTELNQRTGEKVAVWPELRVMNINLHGDYVPSCGVRKTNPHHGAAENAWCLMGDRHIDWLSKHISAWNAFADPPTEMVASDGSQFTSRQFREAYGYRWRHAFGRDQIAGAVKALCKNPSDRRVWISSWDPREDGLENTSQKSVPCPVGFTLQIVGGHLTSTLMLRSSDTLLGLPHDVFRHSFFMSAFAATVNCKLGVLSVAIANSHLYEAHREIAANCLNQPLQEPGMRFPTFSIEQILGDPDLYVEAIKTESQRWPWPAYNPRPELIK